MVVLAGSLVVDRLWCRYLCPAGAVFAVAGHLSFLRIRRHASACTDCGLCNPPCPVGIDVAHAQTVNTDCVGCMESVSYTHLDVYKRQVPDYQRYPTGRDLSETKGELGLAGHWLKLSLHHLFLYKNKGLPGWSLIPE